MSHELNSDKYQIALDAVIEQMNLLSNDPSNENLRLAYEQAQQRFIQISKMEKDEYEKYFRLKHRSQIIHHRPNGFTEDRIEQTWIDHLPKLYFCSFILVFILLTLAIICILISLK